MNYVYIFLIKRRDTFIPDIIKNTLLNLFGYHSFAFGGRGLMTIEFVGDAVQYFGFNKQVLVQTTEKEMHTVVNCRMLCTVDPKQFCTSFFVFLPSD
jgi:hypothetical protein